MDIRIKTTDFSLTADLSHYLDEKLASIAKLLGEHETTARCEVELGRAVGHSHQGNVWRAHMTLTYSTESLSAEAVAESMNAAIDQVKDEMLKRVRRTKDRRFALMRRAGARLKKWTRFGR